MAFSRDVFIFVRAVIAPRKPLIMPIVKVFRNFFFHMYKRIGYAFIVLYEKTCIYIESILKGER